MILFYLLLGCLALGFAMLSAAFYLGNGKPRTISQSFPKAGKPILHYKK